MRIFSDQLLLARKRLNVVTDGLVAWIDGRDGIQTPSSGNSSFLNRADNNRLEIVNNDNPSAGTTSIYATVGSDGFMKIDGSSIWFFRVSLSASVPSVRTTEIVLKPTNGATSMYMLGNGWNAYSDGQISQKSLTRLNSRQTTSLTGSLIHLTCVSTASSKVYRINNEVVATDSLSSSSTSTLTRFDSSGGIYIGSFRVYNRALTAEELAKNYNYEKALGRVPA